MSYLIFTLIFITGLLIVLLISDKFSFGEKLGLSFIVGLGYSSFLMFFLDATHLGILITNLAGALIATITVTGGILAFLYSKKQRRFQLFPNEKPGLKGITLPWLVFFAYGAYMAYGITVKCLYWPPAEFDSIQGYDLLAKAIAHEGTIANSVLLNTHIVADCGPRLLYPPLFASCNAICYMAGMDSPKLITAIFFLSWLVLFYSLVKRFVPHTAAIVATFFMMIAPEMFANASFTLTNLPTAIYAATAVLGFYIWYQLEIEGFFYLSILALLFATWTRSDAVVFYPAMMLVLLFDAWKKKSLKHILSFGIISIIPFVLWHFYLTSHIERQQDSFFIKNLFFDSHKIGEVLGAAKTMTFNTQLYGLVFYLLVAMIGFNIVYKAFLFLSTSEEKRRSIFTTDDRISFLVVAVGGWALYTVLFYQMKNTDGSLFAPGGWMLSGYKRGMFSFVPLAMFYCVANPLAMWLYGKINSWVS